MSEIRVNNVIADNGLDAVNFSKGINVSSGIITATTFSGNVTGNITGNVTSDRIIPTGGVPSGGGGGIVRMQIANSTTNEQNTSGDQTWTLVGPQITYTAASSSNKLVFLHNHHMMTENLTWSMGLWRDGTSGTLLYRMETYDQSAIWQATQGIGSVVVDAPDTSSHTYQFAIWRNGGSDGKIRYSPNSNSTGSQVILMEVSA